MNIQGEVSLLEVFFSAAFMELLPSRERELCCAHFNRLRFEFDAKEASDEMFYDIQNFYVHFERLM
jgi:transposase-like protein